MICKVRILFAAVLAFVLLINPGMIAAQSLNGQYMSLPAGHFSTGQTVEVYWHNAPGNAQDWITVAPANSPDKEWGKWAYLRGKQSGVHKVSGLGPGRYQARIYWNWPSGGYNVVERLEFEIGATTGAMSLGAAGSVTGAYLSAPKSVFSASEPVLVYWQNAPGNNQDWITVAPANSSDKEWGKWAYLRGKRSGVHKVTGLKPGRYQARIYWNWPSGGYNVVERITFDVQ